MFVNSKPKIVVLFYVLESKHKIILKMMNDADLKIVFFKSALT